MYIQKIEIENVRGFEKVDLDLTRPDGSFAGWTVIAGPNGSGKSTLLKAIALAVAGPMMAGRLEKSFAGWVREGATQARVAVKLERSSRDTVHAPGGSGGPVFVRLRWEENKSDGPEPSLVPDGEDLATGAGPWAPNPKGWFIAGYGPARRMSSRDTRERSAPAMFARLNALFDEDAYFAETIRWLKDMGAALLGRTNPRGISLPGIGGMAKKDHVDRPQQ